MAIANSYPVGTPKAADLLLGTSVPTPGTNEKATTKNFALSAVTTLATLGYVEVTKTLTNAEWLALPTTSVVVIPSQGAGKAIKILEAILKFNFISTAFFFPNGITLGTGATGNISRVNQCFIPGDSSGSGFDDLDGDELLSLGTQNAKISINSPIYIGCPSGTNTGDGTVTVTLRYQVIEHG